MKTIAICSRKGGTGKTTTAITLGSYLLKENSVLFIDADSQGNLTFATGIDGQGKGLYELLKGAPVWQTIKMNDEVDIITASKNLSISPWTDAEVQLAKRRGEDLRMSLKKALNGLPYDYCIIDCPPALNEVVVNALYAADAVIIPLKADRFSVESLEDIEVTIKSVHKPLAVGGIVVTAYNKRSTLQQQMLEMIQEKAADLNAAVYTVRQSIALAEAEALQDINVYRYAPKVSAIADYTEMFEDLLKKGVL